MKINENTPVQEINDSILSSFGVKLFVKRDDLNHPQISGNKWFKLKYNLEEARIQQHTTLLTFGGSFSNHIAATAAAGKEYDFKTIGIIRGDEKKILNSTLKFASECGMKLHFISREKYREKENSDFLEELKKIFGNFYLLPEGGSNLLAVKGCAEIIKNVSVPFDYVCCSCGTGTTLAGIASSLNTNQKAIGFSSLKGADFLEKNIQKMIVDFSGKDRHNWQINHDFHFGRYAKVTNELKTFISDFELKHTIPLDFVYTGKLFFGIYDLIQKGFFVKGETILVVHTGGLQGNAGFTSPKKALKN
ncbi:MAG: pyridoxal-phosphate dependent enzyme [Bacteroidia bacterium]